MTVSYLISIGFFVGALLLVSHLLTYHWRSAAAIYPAPKILPPTLARKFPEVILMTAGGLRYTSYAPLTVRVHTTGISLTAHLPLMPFCPPIFLPCAETRMKETSWYLMDRSFALRTRRSTGVEIIIRSALEDWLRNTTERVGHGWQAHTV